nr:MAG TPA: hypothetical protein [Caudoviricetes sp.]
MQKKGHFCLILLIFVSYFFLHKLKPTKTTKPHK